LFQEEVTSLSSIPIRIGKNAFNNPENFIIKIRLFFSNGSKNYQYNLADIMEIDGDPINETMFQNRN